MRAYRVVSAAVSLAQEICHYIAMVIVESPRRSFLTLLVFAILMPPLTRERHGLRLRDG